MDNPTCEQCAELLSAQLDDMISQEENKALEAHLAKCPEYRQLAYDLEQLHKAFADIQEAQPPARIVQGVMARIAKERRRCSVFKTLAGLAACAVICVGLYGRPKHDSPLSNPSSRPQSAPTRSWLRRAAKLPTRTLSHGLLRAQKPHRLKRIPSWARLLQPPPSYLSWTLCRKGPETFFRRRRRWPIPRRMGAIPMLPSPGSSWTR